MPSATLKLAALIAFSRSVAERNVLQKTQTESTVHLSVTIIPEDFIAARRLIEDRKRM